MDSVLGECLRHDTNGLLMAMSAFGVKASEEESEAQPAEGSNAPVP